MNGQTHIKFTLDLFHGHSAIFPPCRSRHYIGKEEMDLDQIYKPLHEYIQRTLEYSYKVMTNDESGK